MTFTQLLNSVSLRLRHFGQRVYVLVVMTVLSRANKAAFIGLPVNLDIIFVLFLLL